MIHCTLGEKTYFIDYVSGRALREIDDALAMHTRILEVAKKAEHGETLGEEDRFSIKDALDVMVKWFCVLFGNQFTPEEVYDKYPVDGLLHDITFAIMAVNAQTTGVLTDFPMTAAQEKKD